MSEDSRRRGTRSTLLATTSVTAHAATSTTALTTSSSGPGTTRPANDSTSEKSASSPSDDRISRYIETRPISPSTRVEPAVSVVLMTGVPSEG